jgi:hypothetical protein
MTLFFKRHAPVIPNVFKRYAPVIPNAVRELIEGKQNYTKNYEGPSPAEGQISG